MAKRIVFALIRILVSGMFGVAACFKLAEPNMTHLFVYQYQLVSWELSQQLAVVLPWVELLAALGLWISRVRLGASILCAGLTIVFLGALSAALVRHIDITCGCFGAADTATTLVPRILEDLGLLALSMLLVKEAATRVREQLLFGSVTDK